MAKTDGLQKSTGPISTIKPTFAGGEYAPNLHTRVDLEKYTSGARLLRNFFVHPQGGASNRPGTYYVATAKTFVDPVNSNLLLDRDVRMLPFEFSSTQKYAIEAGYNYFRFFTNGGQILNLAPTAWATATPYVVGNFVLSSSVVYYCIVAHTSAAAFATDLTAGKWVAQNVYEIPTTYLDTYLPDLQYAQSADVLFMVHGSVKPKQLNRLGNTNWTLTDYDFQGGPFMPSNTSTVTLTPSAVTGAGITLTASSATFNLLHVGSLWRLRQYIEGQTSSVSVTATGVQTGIKCGGTWRIITHGTWTAKFNVERSIDGGTTWQVIRQFSSVNDNNISTFQTDDNDGDPYLVRINTTSYTSGTIQIDLTTDPFTQEGWFKATAYTSTTVLVGTVTRDFGLTTATKDWAEGSWSDYRGWPSSISFAQDRLTFGGTAAEPMTSWMTETGNYYSFKRHNPLIATDGISVNLPARQLNAINWLLPLGTLVAGTSSLIWTISAADKVLTPTSVNQTPSDYVGATRVLPVIIGTRAIYVQVGGSVVRDLAFSFTDDGYVSTNISILATHLFNNYQIKELAYQQSPNNIVWGIRSDGQMLAMTYLREQEVLAWTHHDTQGSFKSICTLQGSEFSELWLAVKRGTNNKRYIETMANRMVSTETADQFFVDCGITYDGVPAQIITGLGHLEGMSVSVLADGNVIPSKVVTAGQINLDGQYSKVHVGLGYVADLETLNVEIPTSTGTAQGKKTKISKITIQCQNSLGGLIGPNFSTLHDIGQSFTRYYDRSLGLFTGDFPENLGAGFEDGGRVCIRQAEPLPISILSLIPTVTVGGVSLVNDSL